MINTPFVFRGTESGTGTTRQTELPAKLCGIDQVIWMTARRDTVSGSTDSQAPCLECVTTWQDQSKYGNNATLTNSPDAVNDSEYWPDYWTGDTTSNYLPFISFDSKDFGPDSPNFLNIPYDSSFSELTEFSFSTIFRTRRINPNITTEPSIAGEVVLFQNGNDTVGNRNDGWGIDYRPGANSVRLWYYDSGKVDKNEIEFVVNDMTDWLRLTVRVSGATMEANLFNETELLGNSGFTWTQGDLNNCLGCTGVSYGNGFPANPDWFIASQKGPDWPSGLDKTILEGSWDIAEYILYTQYLPDSCVNTIWNYFEYRYGITNVQPLPDSCGTSIDGLTTTIGDPFGGTDTFLRPVNGLVEYSWSASIYESSEIGSARQITGIEYYVDQDSKTFFNQTIIIAHVSGDRFTGGTTTIGLSEMNMTDITTGYTGTITMSQFGWDEITFTENFCYNGTDNLIVIWENRDGSVDVSPPSFEYDTTFKNNVAYASKDTGFPGDGDISVSSGRPVIRFSH